VLKGRSSSLFVPPLPERKQRAIRNIGFGLVNKVFVGIKRSLPRPILHNEKGKEHFPEGSCRINIASHVGIDDDCSCWTDGVYVVEPDESAVSPVHRIWLYGEAARLAEEEYFKGNLKMGEQIKALLERVTGDEWTLVDLESQYDETIDPDMRRVLISSTWGSDPCFLGSYSYLSVDCSEDDVTAFSAPITQYELFPTKGEQVCSKLSNECSLRICFAGEATSEEYFGTLHGAYLSGRREAERIALTFCKPKHMYGV